MQAIVTAVAWCNGCYSFMTEMSDVLKVLLWIVLTDGCVGSKPYRTHREPVERNVKVVPDSSVRALTSSLAQPPLPVVRWTVENAHPLPMALVVNQVLTHYLFQDHPPVTARSSVFDRRAHNAPRHVRLHCAASVSAAPRVSPLRRVCLHRAVIGPARQFLSPQC